MSKANYISQEYVTRLFTYEEGQLLWREKKKGRKRKQAGFKSKAGYTQIRIDGSLFYLHRLVWIYHNGDISNEIDHIDGNPENNLLGNLREATHRQNLTNVAKLSNNKSGFRGVSKCPSGWIARIRISGKYAHLGVFKTPEAASDAYQKAASVHHGEFIRSNQ